MKMELRSVPVLGPACAMVGNIFRRSFDQRKGHRQAFAPRGPCYKAAFDHDLPRGHAQPRRPSGLVQKGGFMLALEMGLPILPGIAFRLGAGPAGQNAGALSRHHSHQGARTIDGQRLRARPTRTVLMQDVRAVIASGLERGKRG